MITPPPDRFTQIVLARREVAASGRNAGMTQHALDFAEICTTLDHPSREAMPKCVRCCVQYAPCEIAQHTRSRQIRLALGVELQARSCLVCPLLHNPLYKTLVDTWAQRTTDRGCIDPNEERLALCVAPKRRQANWTAHLFQAALEQPLRLPSAHSSGTVTAQRRDAG